MSGGFARIIAHLADKVITERLAQSPAFQRFAYRTVEGAKGIKVSLPLLPPVHYCWCCMACYVCAFVVIINPVSAWSHTPQYHTHSCSMLLLLLLVLPLPERCCTKGCRDC